jgi:hypothetical protein
VGSSFETRLYPLFPRRGVVLRDLRDRRRAGSLWQRPPRDTRGHWTATFSRQESLAKEVDEVSHRVRAGHSLASRSLDREAIALDGVARHLTVDPMVETRNRKPMRSNPIAPWELRLDNLLVYFDIVVEPDPVVVVLAVGVKERKVVRIGKGAIDL